MAVQMVRPIGLQTNHSSSSVFPLLQANASNSWAFRVWHAFLAAPPPLTPPEKLSKRALELKLGVRDDGTAVL